MTPEDLAKAVTDIKALVVERDDLRDKLINTINDRERWRDRCDLVQVKLENAERDRDLYMRTAAAYAERINAIGLLADNAKAAVAAAVKDGILKSEAQSELPKPMEKLGGDNDVYPTPLPVMGDPGKL